MTHRMRPVVALTLVVAIFAAACSGDDDVAVGDGDGTPTPTVEPTGEPSSTPEPTATPTEGAPDPNGTPTAGPRIDEAALAEVEDARSRWEERGLVTYSFTFSRSCECLAAYGGPFDVSVVDGEVVSTTTFGEPAPPDAVVWTVEEMFAEIRDAISSGLEVEVTYDPTYGHPVQVNLDLEAIAVDGGVSLRIESFFAAQEVAATVADARARWEAAGVDSYDLVYRLLCFCPEIVVTSTVRPGEETVWTAESEGQPIDVGDPVVLTVEDMFDQLDAAIAAGPAALTVQTDDETGHPTSYYVDEDVFIADEEYGITVESLTPVP